MHVYIYIYIYVSIHKFILSIHIYSSRFILGGIATCQFVVFLKN